MYLTTNRQVRHNRIKCIGVHSFEGMVNLKHVDLFSNLISTIDARSFDRLEKLETMLDFYTNQK